MAAAKLFVDMTIFHNCTMSFYNNSVCEGHMDVFIMFMSSYSEMDVNAAIMETQYTTRDLEMIIYEDLLKSLMKSTMKNNQIMFRKLRISLIGSSYLDTVPNN